jgi:hypothetical protein
LISIVTLVSVVLIILWLITVYIRVRPISQYGRRDPDNSVNGLCQHLRTMGIGASVLTIRFGGVNGQPHGPMDLVRAIIKLEGRDIDSINVIQTITGRYLDFIVRNSSPHDRIRSSNAQLIMKRSPKGNLLAFINIWSAKVVDVEWRGDADLARELNLDNCLKDRLLNADLEPLRGILEIVPEPKYGCTRIRASYFLPTTELFGILETIAKHIKSV